MSDITVDDIDAAGSEGASASEDAATDLADVPGHGAHDGPGMSTMIHKTTRRFSPARPANGPGNFKNRAF